MHEAGEGAAQVGVGFAGRLEDQQELIRSSSHCRVQPASAFFVVEVVESPLHVDSHVFGLAALRFVTRQCVPEVEKSPDREPRRVVPRNLVEPLEGFVTEELPLADEDVLDHP